MSQPALDNFQLKSLKLKGFFGSNQLSWEFGDIVNILGGPNGSGKSTVLRAIYHALKNDWADFNNPFNFFDGVEIEMKNGLRFTLSKGGKKEPKWEGASLEVLKFFQDINILYINSADFRIARAVKYVHDSALDKPLQLSMLDLNIEHELNQRNRNFMDAVLNASQQSQGEGIDSVIESFETTFQVLQDFLEGYSLEDRSNLVFRKGKDLIPYINLSTGEKQIVYLCLAISNTYGKPTIALLDEADLGMHIDWKRKLLRELLKLKPDMQIIAATHSPSLIEGWYDYVKEMTGLIFPASQKA